MTIETLDYHYRFRDCNSDFTSQSIDCPNQGLCCKQSYHNKRHGTTRHDTTHSSGAMALNQNYSAEISFIAECMRLYLNLDCIQHQNLWRINHAIMCVYKRDWFLLYYTHKSLPAIQMKRIWNIKRAATCIRRFIYYRSKCLVYWRIEQRCWSENKIELKQHFGTHGNDITA